MFLQYCQTHLCLHISKHTKIYRGLHNARSLSWRMLLEIHCCCILIEIWLNYDVVINLRRLTHLVKVRHRMSSWSYYIEQPRLTHGMRQDVIPDLHCPSGTCFAPVHHPDLHICECHTSSCIGSGHWHWKLCTAESANHPHEK